MAIAPAQTITNVTSSRIYKPAISYQKKIDIEYNGNYGLGIDVDVTSEYRYTLPVKDSTNSESTSRIKLSNFDANTKNTGSNRSATDSIKNQGFTKLDDVGPLPIQNMRAGNFNFTTGKTEYNNNPIIQYSKNIVYDNTQQRNTLPTYQTSGNSKQTFSPLVIGESSPEFFPNAVTVDKCALYWICINDL